MPTVMKALKPEAFIAASAAAAVADARDTVLPLLPS